MLSLAKRKWIIRRKEKDDWDVKKICAHAQINRDTFYYHWNNYLQYGLQGLEIKPRKPLTIHSTEQELVNKVLELRKQFNWGPDKIAGYMKLNNMNIGHNTAYRIICRHGLNNQLDYQRKTWGKKRFERLHSNNLWQADFKLLDNDYWMLSMIDDHARFLTGCNDSIWNPTTDEIISLLEKSIRRFGCPEQILTDQGTQFYCADKIGKEKGISSFTRFCIDNDIEHIVASKRRPTTTGKVERWHRTYDDEHHMFGSIKRFVKYYNYKRPHQSLRYLTPAVVYFRDKK